MNYTVRLYFCDPHHFATLREAADFYDRHRRNGHVWRYGHDAMGEGDTGLTEMEREVVEGPDGASRDVMIALIDGMNSGRVNDHERSNHS